MKKIVIYGLSGSGKSESAKLIFNYYQSIGKDAKIVKIAEPLYEVQRMMFNRMNIKAAFYDQDQRLLEALAQNMRRINPRFLIDDFLDRLNNLQTDVVINDDLRDVSVDYPVLKKKGFRFIRIVCNEQLRVKRLKLRKDRSFVIHSTTTDPLHKIKYDYQISNDYEDIDSLRENIIQILKVI